MNILTGCIRFVLMFANGTRLYLVSTLIHNLTQRIDNIENNLYFTCFIKNNIVSLLNNNIETKMFLNIVYNGRQYKIVLEYEA